MQRLSPQSFIKLFEKLSYDVAYGEAFKPFHLNIVGFRNRFARTDYFDDTIAVSYQDAGKWMYHFFEATTLPGKPSMLKPENPLGTAILAPGQYKDAYEIALHKGKYEALIQRGQVKVYRDNNKDLVYDLNKQSTEWGLFGINIHKASLGAKLVGPNSAGCQVIKDSVDYDIFMALCHRASKFWGSKFTYTLVEL